MRAWTVLFALTAAMPAVAAPTIKADGFKVFDLGAPAAELHVSADGKRALVLHAVEPRVLSLALDKLPASESIPLPAAASSMAQADGKWFVGSRRTGTVYVLDAGTGKVRSSFDLPVTRIRRVLAATAGGKTKLVIVGLAETTFGPAPVAFEIDPADPKPNRGLRLADTQRDSDASISADGRFLYLWRSDSSPTGVTVFDLARRTKIFNDTRLSGPVRADPAGLLAAVRSGEVFTADFALRVGRPEEGAPFFHPDRPLILQAASDAGFTSGGLGLPGSVESRTIRVLSAGHLRPLAEIVGFAGMAIAEPVVASAAKRILWLTAAPSADGVSAPVTPDAPIHAALVVLPFDPDKVPEPDAVRLLRRPDDRAWLGKPYKVKIERSAAGAVAFEKLSGPANLAVDADGVVTLLPGPGDVGKHLVQVGVGGSRLTWTLRVGLEGFDLPGAGELGDDRPLLLTDDGRELITLNADTRELAVLDAATGKPLRAVRPSASPIDLARVGDRLLVLDAGEPALIAVDLKTLKTVARFALPKMGPIGFAV